MRAGVSHITPLPPIPSTEPPVLHTAFKIFPNLALGLVTLRSHRLLSVFSVPKSPSLLLASPAVFFPLAPPLPTFPYSSRFQLKRHLLPGAPLTSSNVLASLPCPRFHAPFGSCITRVRCQLPPPRGRELWECSRVPGTASIVPLTWWALNKALEEATSYQLSLIFSPSCSLSCTIGAQRRWPN